MVRVDRLRQSMAELGIEGLLVTGPENRHYLSAFTGSNGVLIITLTQQAVATDSRYYQQVSLESPGWSLIEVGYDFDSKLPTVLAEMGLLGKKVGFETTHLTVDRYRRWQSAIIPPTQLQETTDVVEELRIQKDAQELSAIRRAAAAADKALAHIFTWLHPGLTERQIAWELERFMRQNGADGLAFDIIVAAGSNAALPHAIPTDRPVEQGEPIILDLGCTIDGYRSDVTRTVCLGTPRDDRYLELWHLVDSALETAQQALFPGIRSDTGDALARDVINQAGWGAYFGHSLGHGVGLAIHERPRLSYASTETVPMMSVLTVEPGIYIPDWGGIRLENLVYMTNEGVEILTKAPKNPLLPITQP
jgi:Xaa-Pro aminopeptidase